MKEENRLRIGNNVYWISAAVAAHHQQAKSKWRRGRFRFALSLPSETSPYEPALASAKQVADELEALLQSRPHHAIGLALAGGALTASLLCIV